MIAGIVFIIAGVLIAVYPPLLSLIAASLLVFLGISFIVVSYHFKKTSQRINNPYLNFFIKF